MKNFFQKVTDLVSGGKSVMQANHYEFISWLKFANAGMLENGNLYCFEYAIKNLPSENPVIEIGSFCGLSTNLISFYLQLNNRPNKLITCDKWFFEGAEIPESTLGGSKISHRQYREFVKQTFIRNTSFFSQHHLPYTIEQFSDDFFKLWRAGKTETDVNGRSITLGGKISFAYIDGNHTYDYAKRDFENVDEFLEAGGFILFDDSSENSEWEVNRVIKEILSNDNYEVVVSNPNFLLRKIR